MGDRVKLPVSSERGFLPKNRAKVLENRDVFCQYVSDFMETDTKIAANGEAGVKTEDFAERVRVNQTKLTSELRPHYDFIVCGSGMETDSVGTKSRTDFHLDPFHA